MTSIPSNRCVRGCCQSDSTRLDLALKDIKVEGLLATGAESEVFTGEFQGEAVAIKKPRLTCRDDLDRFHSELQLLCRLQHDGVASFLGARAYPPEYAMVFKLCTGGNLYDALHIRGWEPTLAESIAVALDFGEALEYIHSQGVVHRDVKPANILLDECGNAVLADFGLAKTDEQLAAQAPGKWVPQGKPTGGFSKRRMVGTTQYMAPEVLRGKGSTAKSDVYSFGVTLNELLTRIVPYADCKTAAQPHTVLEMAYTEQQLIPGITGASLRPIVYAPPPSAAAEEAAGAPAATGIHHEAPGGNAHEAKTSGQAGVTGSAAGMGEHADARLGPETSGVGTWGLGEAVQGEERDGVGMSGAAMDAATVAALVPGATSDWRQLLPALIATCWEEDPSARPSMADVVQSLYRIASFVAADDGSLSTDPSQPAAKEAQAGAGGVHTNGGANGVHFTSKAMSKGGCTDGIAGRAIKGVLLRHPLWWVTLKQEQEHSGTSTEARDAPDLQKTPTDMAVDLPSGAAATDNSHDSQGMQTGGSEEATGAQRLLQRLCGGAEGGEAYRPVLSAGWLLDRGAREYMEDTHCQAMLTFSPQSSQAESQAQSQAQSQVQSQGQSQGQSQAQSQAQSQVQSQLQSQTQSQAQTQSQSQAQSQAPSQSQRSGEASGAGEQDWREGLPPGWALVRGEGAIRMGMKVKPERAAEGEDGAEGRHASGSPQGPRAQDATVHLFGVFDGHRGVAAAEFAAARLPEIAAQHLLTSPSPESALKSAFLDTDRRLRVALEAAHAEQVAAAGGRAQKAVYPGCAASLFVVAGDELLVANAGDCRTVLCSNGKPVPLSQDHLASSEAERRRIVQAGGKVEWRVNTWRVGDAGIEVSRSLGDHDLKPHVTAEPEVAHHRITKDDEFLVMASDGLWSTMSNEAVVRMVQETVKEPGMVAKRLAMAAAAEGSGDNICVLVLFLTPVSSVERIY